MKYKQIHIHSKHRDNFPESKSYDFTHSHQHHVENITHIAGYQISIPNSFHNIHSGNNTLEITDASGTYSVTLEPGFYSPDEVRRTLEAELNASGTTKTYSVAKDDVLKAYTISINDATGLVMDGTSTMARILGFLENGNISSYTDTVSKLTSDGSWDLSGRREFYVACKNLPIANEVKRVKKSILMKVLVDVGLNEIIHYTIPDPTYHFITLKKQMDFKDIDIQLLDEDMELLDNNQYDWSMTILVQVLG